MTDAANRPARPPAPMVSVVIPCRNERAHVEKCLQSLLAQDDPGGGFEIILADGMSTDGTRELLSQIGDSEARLSVIDNPGRIVSTGLNAAISVARGTIIIRADVHTEYAPDYIRQCVHVLETTGADNVGGPWVARPHGYVGAAIAAGFHSRFGSGGARAHDRDYEGPVDTVYLGCWRRECFDKLGGFDEELVRNQDDEFNLRIVRSGGVVWQSRRIRSWYVPRSSLRQLFRQYLQYGYWKVRVIQKHRLPASVRHLIPAAFVAAVLVSFVLMPLAWWARAAFMVLTLAYGVAVLAGSLATAMSSGWKLLPVLPLVFAVFHFSYGLGFLRGIVDFMLLRRGAVRKMSVITRGDGSAELSR